MGSEGLFCAPALRLRLGPLRLAPRQQRRGRVGDQAAVGERDQPAQTERDRSRPRPAPGLSDDLERQGVHHGLASLPADRPPIPRRAAGRRRHPAARLPRHLGLRSHPATAPGLAPPPSATTTRLERFNRILRRHIRTAAALITRTRASWPSLLWKPMITTPSHSLHHTHDTNSPPKAVHYHTARETRVARTEVARSYHPRSSAPGVYAACAYCFSQSTSVRAFSGVSASAKMRSTGSVPEKRSKAQLSCSK